MARGIAITGTNAARIAWHYYTAADVCAYTVARDEAGAWSAVATIVHGDAFKLAQQPLTLEVPTQHGAWIWPIEAFTREGATVRATLGRVTVRRINGPLSIRATESDAPPADRRGVDRDQTRIDGRRTARTLYLDAARARRG